MINKNHTVKMKSARELQVARSKFHIDNFVLMTCVFEEYHFHSVASRLNQSLLFSWISNFVFEMFTYI